MWKGCNNLKNFGFLKVAAASPRLKVGNPEYNRTEIVSLIKAAEENHAGLIAFPELCLTGYTCGDLFHQRRLLEGSLESLHRLLEETRDTKVIAVIGIPLLMKDSLYNCAIAVQSGSILGVVPKMSVPNYKEFYEKRWFTSGSAIAGQLEQLELLGQTVPFGRLIFDAPELHLRFGIEICEDLWTPIPPSSFMVLKGANVIVNPSASNELVTKSSYRRELIAQQSARGICAYLYASAGVHESTTDVVFSGDSSIYENGTCLSKSERFLRENSIIYSIIDLEKLESERQLNKSFSDSIIESFPTPHYLTVPLKSCCNPFIPGKDSFDRRMDRNPFVPSNPVTMNEHCEDIFQIQVAGLAKRFEHTGIKKAVIGISGGLDSTLAFLVLTKTFCLLGIPTENIHGITMPGFGTTGKTYENAMALMNAYGVTVAEIDIKPACLQHFSDIGHDACVHDLTYENTQARERTQVLMDYAAKIGGLVVGTGDLSELALGWCTYNGDHMSMYGVNCSVPKTLVQHLIRWFGTIAEGQAVSDTLAAILQTPISPELLPPDSNGEIKQITEDVIGPYELHDFFLFHFLRFGSNPSKILFLASIAFEGQYETDEIKKWLREFLRRFFSQQFKRSCLPDGPKVGSVSLSPRGDWRMPSDADASLWLSELE